MYGDCQVMSSMGVGNRVINNNSSDGLFSSPLHNPSDFNFMMANSHHHHHHLPFQSFSNIIVPKEEASGLMGVKGKEDMPDSGGSGSEHIEGGMSGNELDNIDQLQPKKKRYHRHTSRQIQEMESVFKECPHPDDKQRMKLSQDLGLKPRQVKFWFQNRRTQMKAQQDRSDNVILRAENENLRNENYRLQAALRNIVCPNCGGPAMVGELSIDEQQLRIENARLKEELDRVCSIAARYGTRQFSSMGGVSPQQPPPHLLQSSLELDMGMYNNPRHFGDTMQDHNNCNEMMPIQLMPEDSHFHDTGVIILEDEKHIAVELSISSMDQLMKMCHATEPLWVRSKENGGKEVLNLDEYVKMFPWMMNSNNNSNNQSEFRIEATRESAVVIMNSITLVDAFLDANKWMELFPSIISRAKTIQVLGSGVSGHANGCLQLMHAEFQVLSPLVPTREAYFLRYCQQNMEEGSWAIVDFPMDSFHNSFQPSFPKYKRRPSGCLIQDMPNGYSRVTWVEHVEMEEKPVHQIFNQIVLSGMAFGASRWLAILQRQCERLASLMARNISDLGVIPSPEARKNMMNLAQRMIKTFSVNMTTCNGQSWTALSDAADDTVRITTRKMMEPGQPNGVILTAVSTTWLPYQHDLVFDLLRDERRRSQMEILSNGTSLHEVAHIANGSHPGNCISLLRINVASNSSQNVELMLQESCIDQSGSLIVYSTIDVDSIQLAMSGEDPSCIPILPMGFSIIPLPQPPSTTKSTTNSGDETNQKPTSEDQHQTGCLLTVGLQVVASSMPTAKLSLSSVSAINNHLCNTVNQISAALRNICHENGRSRVNSHDSVAAPNQSTDHDHDQ